LPLSLPQLPFLDLSQRQLGTTYLSEKEVRVRAEPPLLLPALQQHHGLRHQSVFLLQPAAQSPAVLGEQSGGHPQGLVTQPVDGSERTGTGRQRQLKDSAGQD